jgi:hypothetical protein
MRWEIYLSRCCNVKTSIFQLLIRHSYPLRAPLVQLVYFALNKVFVMRAKPRGHVGPRDRAGRAGRCAMAFVTLGIDCALASASDLAGLGTPL